MSEHPKIQIVGPTPPPFHGVSVSIQTLLNSGITKRFRVVHLETADRRGIDFVDKPDWYDVWLFVKQFCKNCISLAKEQPDLFYIVISQSKIGFLRDSLFIVPAFIARCPVVVHLHGASFGTLYDESGYLWKRYCQLILRRVTWFIVLGEILKPIFSRWTSARNVSVVPNGVPRADGTDCSASQNGRYKSDRRLIRVLALSTLSRAKGLFVLLETIALVVRDHQNVEFHIAGPWWGATTQSEAMAWIAAAGIRPYVHFVGQLIGQRKAQFLRSGDVFVFPGVQQEGQPLTVLEAMSEGLPVIATDRGCIRETIQDGSTGFVVAPSSPSAIAEKLLLLIQQPELLFHMGRNARVRFEREYTMDLFVGRMEGVFREVLSLPTRSNLDYPSRSEAS